MDESDEINAAAAVDVDVDVEQQEWLVMFKMKPTIIHRNGTFGGAATCLGGAMRDLFQEELMFIRLCVTGSGDPKLRL